ncbi:MAG: PTS sugar transporter subunit IIA [Ignavibacteriales bacterium]|nr:MAG: PTS sugar transporter subunit IIA [Ignavibacteriales bacterium]
MQNLLKPEYVFFTDVKSKEDIISFLSQSAAKNLKIKADDIYGKVMERENSNPTGIANYLAIPHTRIKSSKPFIAVAINKKGINFDSSDNLPSRIFIMLLTPESENELQLKLLSEIVKKFRDKEKVIKLLSLKEETAVIKALEEM